MIYGYARVSTKGQAKDGNSLEAQENALRSAGATKIHAGTALRNVPSVILLKRLGFELIGTEEVSFFKDVSGNDIYFEGGNFLKNLTLDK